MCPCFQRILSFLMLVLLAASLVSCYIAERPPQEIRNKPPGGTVVPERIVAVSGAEPAPLIQVKLIMAKAPRLHEAVDVSLVIECLFDAPKTEAQIILPAGGKLNSGSLQWTGDLKAKQPVTLNANIQFEQTGQLTLQGKASSAQPNGDVWADLVNIYLTVTEESGSANWTRPRQPAADGGNNPTPPAVDAQQ